MKSKLLTLLAIGMLGATSVNAQWVYADSGKQLSCCHKATVVKKVKAPEVCETCDYSSFKDAVLLPVGNEKLQPARLENCGK